MKKTLLAAALLAGFAGAASAQSSVTLYGILDGGLRYQTVSFKNNTSASNFGAAYGVNSGNRIGFRGTEDIGGGNRINFQLEAGINLGDGVTSSNNQFFNRASWIGVSNTAWGDVRLGRMTNLTSDWMVGGFDPFAASFGQLNMGHAFTSGNTVRLSNTLMYRTPNMSGFQAGIGYSFATGLTSNGGAASAGSDTGYNFATSNNTRALTLGARYANGPVLVAATYEQAMAAESNAKFSGQSVKNWNLGGSYDFKVVKIAAAYGQTRDGFWAGSGAGATGAELGRSVLGNNTALAFAPSVGYNSYIVGATVPVNPVSRVLLSWTLMTPNGNMQQPVAKGGYDASNQSSYNLGYQYDFTKRTNLYAYVGTSTNYAMVESAKSTLFGVGMRHQF